MHIGEFGNHDDIHRREIRGDVSLKKAALILTRLELNSVGNPQSSAKNAAPLQVRAMEIARNTRKRYNQNAAEQLCGHIIKNLASVPSQDAFHDSQRVTPRKALSDDSLRFFLSDGPQNCPI